MFIDRYWVSSSPAQTLVTQVLVQKRKDAMEISNTENLFKSIYKQFGMNTQIIELENNFFDLACKLQSTQKENAELKDKVSRRNMQIKDKDRRLQRAVGLLIDAFNFFDFYRKNTPEDLLSRYEEVFK